MAKKKNANAYKNRQDRDPRSDAQKGIPTGNSHKKEQAERADKGEKSSDKAERTERADKVEKDNRPGKDRRADRPEIADDRQNVGKKQNAIKDTPNDTSGQDKPKSVKDDRTKTIDESTAPEKRVALRREDKDGTKPGSFLPENARTVVISALKILLPVAACAIVIAVLISYAGSKDKAQVPEPAQAQDTGEIPEADPSLALSSEPLEENSYAAVNELMSAFYTALADGDIEKIKTFKENCTDKEILTYEERSRFTESYDDLACFTKPGMEDGSYFVYVSYNVKIKDINTKAPGLKPWYVYPAEDGSLKVKAVDEEENIYAAFKLVTVQDDVVDLFNKIDVSYKEAIASDEALSAFIEEFPSQINKSVGVALAQLETQDEQESESQSQPQAEEAGGEEPEGADAGNEEQPQNQTVNQTVRATATVNVRSSDSEEADKIGKAQTGAQMTRIEERVNGWSKVIFDGKEAYVKSDYLEVVSEETTEGPVGSVKAKTNVNVRNAASQEADKLGTAQAGVSYDLLEDQGEWFKIRYNGQVGFVKAEYFLR